MCLNSEYPKKPIPPNGRWMVGRFCGGGGVPLWWIVKGDFSEIYISVSLCLVPQRFWLPGAGQDWLRVCIPFVRQEEDRWAKGVQKVEPTWALRPAFKESTRSRGSGSGSPYNYPGCWSHVEDHWPLTSGCEGIFLEWEKADTAGDYWLVLKLREHPLALKICLIWKVEPILSSLFPFIVFWELGISNSQ